MLLDKLEKTGIRKALEDLGFDFAEIFGEITEEKAKLYEAYSWEKVDCSVEGILKAYVIHAVPPQEQMEEQPWEEWFFQWGVPQHHVLFLKKNPQCTEEILIPAKDQDHPKEVAGKYWYYYNDTDSRPFLAQG